MIVRRSGQIDAVNLSNADSIQMHSKMRLAQLHLACVPVHTSPYVWTGTQAKLHRAIARNYSRWVSYSVFRLLHIVLSIIMPQSSGVPLNLYPSFHRVSKTSLLAMIWVLWNVHIEFRNYWQYKFSWHSAHCIQPNYCLAVVFHLVQGLVFWDTVDTLICWHIDTKQP